MTLALSCLQTPFTHRSSPLAAAWRAFALLALTTGPVLAENPQWVQVHATIHYRRTGTIVTASDGTFTFNLDASIDEMMERVAPNQPAERASYVLDPSYARSFELSGTTSLVAAVSQYDEPTKKTYHASANLKAALGKAEELRIEEVSFNPYLSAGYMVKVPAKLKLAGAVHSDYPRMPQVAEEDSVLIWPTPVRPSADEGFIAEGEPQFYSALVKRPEDKTLGMVYDMVVATDSMPGVGGLRPPMLGGTTTGQGEDWTYQLSTRKDFDTLVGGHYSDDISVTVKIVPTTLPLPKKLEE